MWRSNQLSYRSESILWSQLPVRRSPAPRDRGGSYNPKCLAILAILDHESIISPPPPVLAVPPVLSVPSPYLPLRTHAKQRTLPTVRTSSNAHSPTMKNDLQMQCSPSAFWKKLLQVCGHLIRCIFARESQTVSQAKDVSVDGESRLSETLGCHHTRRLFTHSRELHQQLKVIRNFPPVLTNEFPRHRHNILCLAVEKSTAADIALQSLLTQV